ncbi:MAG: hypothetical protein Q8941_13730 [Bacteroidota bacterium]|nr:hypothetical protein [Bacteroidota bacterium]
MKAQVVFLSIAILAVNSSGTIYSSLTEKSLSNQSGVLMKKQNTDFAFFRTHRQGKGVESVWGLTSIDGVAGFLVQRTYDDPTDPYAMWEDLGSVPSSPFRSFKYIDQTVFPGYINYRIKAMMADGSSIISEVSGVRIVSH